MPIKNHIPRQEIPIGRRITSLLPGAALLIALIWLSSPLDITGRILLFRYLIMLFAAVMAFITPHLLFPDPQKSLLLLLNLSPKKLFYYHLLRLKAPGLFAVASLLIIAYTDTSNPLGNLLQKSQLLFEGTIALIAILLYALYRYATLGDASQKWNEGKRAEDKTGYILQKMGTAHALKAGLFPTFLSTMMVTFTGMMSVVLYSAIPNPVFAGTPFILFAGWSAWKLKKNLSSYDRHLYQSDAFYDELFANPVTGTKEGRDPVSHDAVYWVPLRWRHAVWSQMIQMDRKRPMGRIILLLSATWWLLLWMGVPDSWNIAWLFFWILSKNMLLWPSTKKKISPPSFHWWLMPPSDWVAVRFFLQLRWIPALFLTLTIPALFSSSFGGTDVALWIALDLLISLLSAVIMSLNNEFTYKKRYL